LIFFNIFANAINDKSTMLKYGVQNTAANLKRGPYQIKSVYLPRVKNLQLTKIKKHKSDWQGDTKDYGYGPLRWSYSRRVYTSSKRDIQNFLFFWTGSIKKKVKFYVFIILHLFRN